MNDCIFCRIVSGEIPSMIVYEDDLTLAFMDIAKDVDGHILVIPKKHCRNILDCDEDTLFAVAKTVKTVSKHLTDHCGYEGVNLLNASDESAGQSVPHFHIHIIPRKGMIISMPGPNSLEQSRVLTKCLTGYERARNGT